MLVITQLIDKRLAIKCDYYYKDRIKKIPTATFDCNLKQWIICDFMLGMLEQEFKGELVYKTPRWVILNQPMPDMAKMYEIHDKTIEVPALAYIPYDYQNYGIRFMIDKINEEGFVLNADDVGLGKTIQSIGVIKWFIEHKGIKKILIICKKSIKKQWIDEIKKFAPDILETFVTFKTEELANKRKKAYKNFDQSDCGILITNYHNFLNDTELIKETNPDFIIIDEVHSVKARKGKLNSNISKVCKGKPTIFLTGTPIMSKPEDIFGIVQICNTKYFGTWKSFSERYITIANTNYGMKVVGAKNLDELRELVQNIIIRRTEFEVSIQLPKTNIIPRYCEMDDTQRTLLKAIEEQSLYLQQKKESLLVGNIVPPFRQEEYDRLEAQQKGLISAKQAVATDPRMFLRSRSKAMQTKFAPFVPATYKMSNKTENVLDIVQDVLASDSKVIIFSKFRTSAELIGKDIQDNLKANVLFYTGSENDEQREIAIDLFKNSINYNILVGTEAMAEGLNLQVAKYVINLDQPDTLAIKIQRIGRARRAGSQFDSVIVYDMITEGSKDEERLENIKKNENLTDALVSLSKEQSEAIKHAMKESNHE